MKILTRYILIEFLKPFILSLFAFSVIILIVRVFNEMHLIMEHKPTIWVTFKYFFFQIPELLIQIVPIAVLMAVLFSLSQLSKNNELIAMRSGGVSIYLVAIPLFFSGLAICFLSIFLNESLVPLSTKLTNQTKSADILHQPEAEANKYKQNISFIGAGGQLYHIGAFDGIANTLSDVLILEFGPDSHLKSRLDAKAAKYENGQWVFYDGYLRAFDESDNEISAQSFDRLPLSLPEKPGDFLKEQKEPKELNMAELIAYIHQLKQNGSDYHKEMVELNNKIAFPFGCVILAILGVPWGWSMRKYSGVVFSFGVCLLVAFFYLGGMQIGHSLGDSGVISPFFSMWIMNILFAIGGPFLLVWKNR
jgi:lipopolysaccharide export system permease protein